MYFFVIEGQGRTLEEIDTMYIEHVSPMKSSKWEPPSTAEMSRIRQQAGTEVPVSEIEQRGIYSGETERVVDHDSEANKPDNEHTERV